MKELFINNAGRELIQHDGFFIANTSWVPAIITGYTFIKDRWGALHISNFIDADAIDFSNFDMIKNSLYEELYFFKSKSDTNAAIYFKIFVTDRGLSEDTISNILNCYTHSTVKKASFIPVILDLSNKNIIMNNDSIADGSGLISTLKSSLDMKDSFTQTYNLAEVMKDREEKNGYTKIMESRESAKPYVTYFLLAINIFVFILMELSGGTDNPMVLMKFGMKINSLIAMGEYWRLLTSAFIHIGFVHIAFNMYALYNLGPLVERLYGSSRYLLIYISAALCGSISSFLFSPAPSAGASGAIFGLFGALLYIGRRNPRLFSTSFGINILIVIGINLFFGFTTSGIDNFAHIGGLIGGYLCSVATGLKPKNK